MWMGKSGILSAQKLSISLRAPYRVLRLAGDPGVESHPEQALCILRETHLLYSGCWDGNQSWRGFEAGRLLRRLLSGFNGCLAGRRSQWHSGTIPIYLG